MFSVWQMKRIRIAQCGKNEPAGRQALKDKPFQRIVGAEPSQTVITKSARPASWPRIRALEESCEISHIKPFGINELFGSRSLRYLLKVLKYTNLTLSGRSAETSCAARYGGCHYFRGIGILSLDIFISDSG